MNLLNVSDISTPDPSELAPNSTEIAEQITARLLDNYSIEDQNEILVIILDNLKKDRRGELTRLEDQTIRYQKNIEELENINKLGKEAVR